MAQTELGVVLSLSALAQASAAWIALRQIAAVSGRYRFMWGFVALALALMVIGIYGIRQLFIDMKRQKVQLDALARTDALMGLPNRREILERLQTEFEHEGHPLHVTASIGVAIHQADTPQFDAGQLVQRADRALYAAKAAGRDCVVMDAS